MTKRLAPREHEIALLLAEGLDDDAIARQLNVSKVTTQSRIRHIFWRLDLDSRDKLIAWVAARLDSAAPTARLRRE